jgi:hypothetical protein
MSSCYVYEVRVDGIVRYIGKGIGARMGRHVQAARRINAKRAAGLRVRALLFHNKLAKALRDGSNIEAGFIRCDMTDEEAYALERDLIAGFSEGQLWNICEGGGKFTALDGKRRWADPAFRESCTARIHEGQQASPVFKDRVRAASRKKWDEPGFRERRSRETKALFQDAAFKERWRAANKPQVYTEERRQKVSAAIARYNEDETVRARKAKFLEEYLAANPGEKERRLTASRAVFKSPEFIEKERERKRQLWADPEFRAKQVEKFKSAWVKRKAKGKKDG